jgi:hypothetical protein
MRTKATDNGRDRYDRNSNTRSADLVFGKRTMSVEDCLIEADKAGAYAASIRSAIAAGNQTLVMIGPDSPNENYRRFSPDLFK